MSNWLVYSGMKLISYFDTPKNKNRTLTDDEKK